VMPNNHMPGGGLLQPSDVARNGPI
jgi:hypothetical protein